MFGIGSTELFIILIVALVVIGPQKLPEMLRSLGKGMAEFKRVGNDVKSTLDTEIKKAEKDLKADEIKKQFEEADKIAKGQIDLGLEKLAESTDSDNAESTEGGGGKADTNAESETIASVSAEVESDDLKKDAQA